MTLLDLREDAVDHNRPLSLLLVEDNPTDALLVEAWLERADLDFEVEHVTGLKAALEALQDRAPDLIVSDLGLPDARGIQAAERLVEAAPDVPLVVLTGASEKELAILALEVGAEDYINKDQMSEDTLRRAIRFAMTRRQAQRRLHTLSNSLEEADSDLGDFAHMVAHDVRAPLRTSRLLAEALSRIDSTPGGQSADLWQRLDDTLGHMDRLVLSMLDYAGLRGPAPALEAVPVKACVERVLAMLQADLERTNADVTVDIDAHLTVRATEDVLARVIENLLTNAIKFRRPKTPLQIDVEAAAFDGGVRIAVHDNGVGVPAAQREQVFRPLERLDKAIEGTGLGLAICRRLVRSVDGDIQIEPDSGIGTTVTLELLAHDLRDEAR